MHAFKWVTSGEFDQYPFTPADEASMTKLLGVDPRSRASRAVSQLTFAQPLLGPAFGELPHRAAPGPGRLPTMSRGLWLAAMVALTACYPEFQFGDAGAGAGSTGRGSTGPGRGGTDPSGPVTSTSVGQGGDPTNTTSTATTGTGGGSTTTSTGSAMQP